MISEDRVIQHKLKVLRLAEQTGNVAETCRYFVSLTSFRAGLVRMINPSR